ncbi:MAG: hypothetical protein WDM96_14790 [Lacunisphaera sp.]
MRAPYSILLLLFLTGGPGLLRAQGGPPLVTDDPGTPGTGHWEVNLAWTHERRPEGNVDELPLLDLNYGWGERVQLKFEGSWLVLSGDGGPHRAGASDALVGVKWRFLDEEKSGLAASVYPQVGFGALHSSVRRGITSGGTVLILPVELQKSFGPLEANVDFGCVADNREDDLWFGGVAVGHEFASHWELLAELHGEAEVGVRGSSLLCNLGARVPLTKSVTLLFSLGQELYNATQSRATVSYLGLQLTR